MMNVLYQCQFGCFLPDHRFERWKGVYGRGRGLGGENSDGERLSKQLLSLPSAASSLSLLLLHLCCQTAEERSKEADMKGIPEILFFGAPFPCSLRYRYGNAESQIQPVPTLQRMPSLPSSSPPPPPRPLLTPSSSSLSILCSLLSPQASR